MRQCLLRFLEAPDLMQEELWAPIATILKLDAREVDAIRLARQSRSAWCALILSDPTSLARTHPALHALLADRVVPALAAVGAAIGQGAGVAWQMAARQQQQWQGEGAAPAAAAPVADVAQPREGAPAGTSISHALSALKDVGAEWRLSLSPAPQTRTKS